jgi:hypothetical protein
VIDLCRAGEDENDGKEGRVVALILAPPPSPRAGCLSDHSHCLEWAWSLDSWWDTFWAVEFCHSVFNRCMMQKLIGA